MQNPIYVTHLLGFEPPLFFSARDVFSAVYFEEERYLFRFPPFSTGLIRPPLLVLTFIVFRPLYEEFSQFF